MVNEAVKVAAKCGVSLDVADCKARVQLVAEQTAGEYWGDRLNGSQSKLDGFGHRSKTANRDRFHQWLHCGHGRKTRHRHACEPFAHRAGEKH